MKHTVKQAAAAKKRKLVTFIVVPAYNEEKTVRTIVHDCKQYGTVLVINDASKDRTAAIAASAGAIVISHQKNAGLGRALRTGFEESLRRGAGVIITIDADGQHVPQDIPKFEQKIQEGYEFVLGQRNLSRYPLIKRIGNFFLNRATNFICKTHLKDTESGFRAFEASALRRLSFQAERYEIAAEIIREVGRHRLRMTNVPVKSPVYVKGVGVSDGIKNFLYLFKR